MKDTASNAANSGIPPGTPVIEGMASLNRSTRIKIALLPGCPSNCGTNPGEMYRPVVDVPHVPIDMVRRSYNVSAASE